MIHKRLKDIRKIAIDLLLTYSREYYIPFNASISQVYSALYNYRKNPSSNSAYKAFWHYCYYLYHEDRLFASGVPLPYKGKEQNDLFFEYMQKTQKLFILSETQEDECLSTLKSLSIPYQLSENYDCYKDIIYNKLTELKSYEVFLSVDHEKLKESEETFIKLYSLLSSEIDYIFNTSNIQTPTEIFTKTLKDFWSEIRDLRNLDKFAVEPEIKREVSIIQIVYTLTAGILGIIYMSVFLPLAWNSAKNLGLAPLNIILFAEIGSSLKKAFEVNLFPCFSGADAEPTLYAIGFFIGMSMFSSALIIIADPLKVVLSTRGLFVALGITTLFGYFMGTLHFDTILFRLFIFKFGYLLITFIILSSLPGLLGRKGIYRVKYEKLFNGLYGIIGGWILSKGFGASAAIYHSILFFVSWFLAIAIVEKFVTHDPRSAVFSMLQVMSLVDFGKRMWAERREIFPRFVIFIIVTLLFHFLIVVIYKNLLAGRF